MHAERLREPRNLAADLAEPGDEHRRPAHLVDRVVRPSGGALVGLEARQPFVSARIPNSAHSPSGVAWTRPSSSRRSARRRRAASPAAASCWPAPANVACTQRSCGAVRTSHAICAGSSRGIAEHDLGARDQLREPSPPAPACARTTDRRCGRTAHRGGGSSSGSNTMSRRSSTARRRSTSSGSRGVAMTTRGIRQDLADDAVRGTDLPCRAA